MRLWCLHRGPRGKTRLFELERILTYLTTEESWMIDELVESGRAIERGDKGC
jgi:hypothetical protein